jgi:hypothetical protein
MGAEDIPSIPECTILSYLNEGAANIVYRIQVRHSTPPPSQLEEYGEGTPPPTEIETEIDEKYDELERLHVFDGMCPFHSCSSSFNHRDCTPFQPRPCHTALNHC